MRQLKYVQILYAFHFDSLPKNGHEHEHGSYHVPWNSRNLEMTYRFQIHKAERNWRELSIRWRLRSYCIEGSFTSEGA